MNLNRTVTVAPGVLAADVIDETLLLELESESTYSLRDVGRRFWQLIRENGDLDAAVAALQREYDVAADRLRADVDALVADLAARGLITLEDTP